MYNKDHLCVMLLADMHIFVLVSTSVTIQADGWILLQPSESKIIILLMSMTDT